MLPATAVRLLAVLVREAIATGYADKGHALYAYRVGCSQRTVGRYLGQLEALRVIKRIDTQENHRIVVRWDRLGVQRG